jgi:hypothetical protein
MNENNIQSENESSGDLSEARFIAIEDKINALSRLMTLMLIFVLTVTLVLFILHWAGHALSHSH